MNEKYHILYVDDEEPNLLSFKASFRRDYHVHLANSGKEALGILAEQPIALVLSDQRMPGMTGVELFEKILPDYPDTVRMVVTGYSDINAIINAINKGKIYYYIAKPWKPQELKVIMDNALESFRLKKENTQLSDEKLKLEVEAERQAKENILIRYETLKNQINPHFLFNSLNALAELLYNSPATAEEFITGLTRVYRHVLEHRESLTISLREELHFMDSYIFLQQIRFSGNLQVERDLEINLDTHFLPPLTLHTLVENAIKHNIVSRTQPLQIDLYIEGEMLVVKNNYQLRKEDVPSTGVGLTNLTERYQYLSEQKPAFYEKEGMYYAKVPLLKKYNPDILPQSFSV